MSKNTKLAIEIIVYVSLVITIVFATPKALSYALGTQYPVASITSGSMWPVLKKGDLVLIEKVERNDLKIGDIIVYKNKNGFTIHRIVELQNETIITKGDANKVSDLPVDYEKIIGRTVNWKGKPIRIPMIGNITIWAYSLKEDYLTNH